MENWKVPTDAEVDRGGEKYRFTGTGEIFSYSVVQKAGAPADFEEFAPYIVALVKLDSGPLVTAQITDLLPHEIKGKNIINMRVAVVTRVLRTDAGTGNGETGAINYGFKFQPLWCGTNGVDEP